MSGRVAPSVLYAGARARVRAVVQAHPGHDATSVPATPGWTVHDVVAHLAGVAEDVAHGNRPAGGPTDAWTAGHVERGRGVPTGDLLDRWDAVAPAVEASVDAGPLWPPVIDAGAHELDLRAAVGDTGGRDSDLVVVGARVLLAGLAVPAPLVVVTEHHDVRIRLAEGADDSAAPVTLRSTDFEVYRWRLGRRSPGQLRAMDWDGDPEPFLPYLCTFGPASADLVE